MSEQQSKRYVVFAGSTYYPSGGWDDTFTVTGKPAWLYDEEDVAAFSSVEDAKTFIIEKLGSVDWVHVVDLQTMRIAWKADKE